MIETKNQHAVISPGSTIGILGSGQLGRMMAIAAKQMGYFVHVFSGAENSPGGQAADHEFIGDLNDLDAIEAFAKNVDVVTVETENIPVSTLEAAGKLVPAFPGRMTLEKCQNRGLEKQFLVDNQIPTCNFKVVRSLDELVQATEFLMPAVLKTTTGGYDGKGQAVIRSHADVEEAWNELKTDEAILEEWIEYDFEFSIVGFRNSDGVLAAYSSIRNEHENGILDVSISPSGLEDSVNESATQMVFSIMEQLDSVGVLTVEFFSRGSEVLVNEIAPRPHNSGHLTIEGHATNQFEQHIRAVCGLKAGSMQQLRPVAMANILGEAWSRGTPAWQSVFACENTKLHLYGKDTPKLGRKMGHMTSIGETPEQAREHVLQSRKRLRAGSDETAKSAQPCC